MAEGIEIERRFLVKKLPDLERYRKKVIAQYYLRAESDMQIRVRRVDGKECTVTQKRAKGLIREEREDGVSTDVFEAMRPAAVSKTIFKTRYLIPHEKLVVELDVYAGFLEGLAIAEVEFPDVESARAFVPLDWFAREVTEDLDYSNMTLAVKGLPNRQHIVDVKEGLTVVDDLIKRLKTYTPAIIVEVMGASATGKTSFVAKQLAKRHNALLISCDDYYRGSGLRATQMEPDTSYALDQPEAFDLDLLGDHLQQLKVGKIVTKPVYDFKTGALGRAEKVAPKNVIIVEGLFTFLPPLDKLGDIKVFVDVGPHGRLVRHMMRDISRAGWDPFRALSHAATEATEPLYKKHIEPYKEQANVIIKSDYNPIKEAAAAHQGEYQVKFAIKDGDRARAVLPKLGAALIASTRQEDVYFSNDAGPQGTKEVIRLRHENGKTIFTYRGPKRQGPAAMQRPSFVVELNEDIGATLKTIYKHTLTLTKQRDFFVFNGVVIAIDDVSVGGVPFGAFVEVQTHDNKQLEKLAKVKKALNLKKPMTETYFEMASGPTPRT